VPVHLFVAVQKSDVLQVCSTGGSHAMTPAQKDMEMMNRILEHAKTEESEE